MTIAQIMLNKLIERVIHESRTADINLDMLIKYTDEVKGLVLKGLNGYYARLITVAMDSVLNDVEEKMQYFEKEVDETTLNDLKTNAYINLSLKKSVEEMESSTGLEFWDKYAELLSNVNWAYNEAHNYGKQFIDDVDESWKRNLEQVFMLMPGQKLNMFSCLTMATTNMSVSKLYGDVRCPTYSTSLITELSRKLYDDRRRGFLFNHTALDNAVAYSPKDLFTSDCVMHGDLLDVQTIADILLSMLIVPAIVYDTDIDYTSYTPMDYVCMYKPLYSSFERKCKPNEVNEILLRKPVEPAGVFIIGDLDTSCLDEHTKAVAKAMELPAFCIDITGKGIKRLL